MDNGIEVVRMYDRIVKLRLAMFSVRIAFIFAHADSQIFKKTVYVNPFFTLRL